MPMKIFINIKAISKFSNLLEFLINYIRPYQVALNQ